MNTEKGTLTIGIEYNGRIHRDFEIRPQLVRDAIEAMEDERAQRNESYLGLLVLAKQTISIGDIPKEKVTVDLLMEMYDVDLAAIHAAAGRLQKRLISFRGEGTDNEKGGPGGHENGVYP